MQDFRNLRVWRKAHEVTLSVYADTNSFPSREMYGLTSQIRRAAYSIPGNLAEGCGRQTDKEFSRSVIYAMGSACELEYFLLLAKDLKYLPEDHHVALTAAIIEVKRMLAALIEKLGGSVSAAMRSSG
jgi:four helix bundle protein